MVFVDCCLCVHRSLTEIKMKRRDAAKGCSLLDAEDLFDFFFFALCL
jgi:sulfur relay (sulfurtransferase) DsrF/TusC family protein